MKGQTASNVPKTLKSMKTGWWSVQTSCKLSNTLGSTNEPCEQMPKTGLAHQVTKF